MHLSRLDEEEKEIRLRPSGLLLRITMDVHRAVTRCSIRQVATGQTAYLQGGPGLAAFIKECLIDDTDGDST